MKIIVGDISCVVDNPRENMKALALVREYCRARPANYMYMPRYRSHQWDGYISLMHSIRSFPTGLLSNVKKLLDDNGYTVELIYKSESGGAVEYPLIGGRELEGIELRDYQIEAANIMLEAGRGVVKMATNSGKTEVMAAVVKALQQKTLILVHRKELLYQTMDRLSSRMSENIGIIGDGAYNPDRITVGMIQTIYNKLYKMSEFIKDIRVLMVDECHHASSDQMLEVLPHIPGYYRFGLSGTPLKKDLLSDMKLIASTGDIIYDLGNRYLIEHGFSATPIVLIKTIESSDKSIWRMNYQEAYDSMVVNNEIRNAAIADYASKLKGTVLVLVNRIDHGIKLNSMIPNSVFVHGEDTTEYRNKILNDMRHNSGVFIASPIFDEGIDVPGMDAVILAAGGKSYIKLLQRVGRGLRRKEGDNILTVVDFIDDTNKYLLDHSDERISTYINEGFETRLE